MIDEETYEMLHDYANKLTFVLKRGVTFSEALKHALETLEEIRNGDK